MSALVRYEVETGGIARITLDSPDTRNALSDALLDETIGAFERARDDSAVRVVVLSSSHDRIFSAGGDLKAFSDDRAAVEKESVRFGCPEINVGVFPFMISALIYRSVPRLRANEMMMMGELMTASEAHSLGFVNKVIPDAEFDAEVTRWAQRIAEKSPLLLRLGKNAVDATRDMTLPQALDALQAQLALAFTTEDIREGVAAFREKRSPEWRMR